jgi:FlaA1/EpsC-like NDP-sugar epimerase
VKPWFERLRSRLVAFLHDLVMVPCAWMLAYWVRFNLDAIPGVFLEGALTALPLVVAIQGASYWRFGLYRGVWRFASLPDLMRIAKAVLAGSAVSFLALFILNRMEMVPRSVPVLFVVFQLMLLAGPRLVYRWLKDHRLNLREGERVLIVGAGRAGEMLARDMLRDPGHAYLPVAFVDDKLRRQGGELHGIAVRGGTEAIPQLVERLGVQLVLLAIPSASAAEMQRLVGLCERSGRPFRTVPQLESLMAGQVSISHLRPVSIEDLLGRNPVQLDWGGIHQGLSGRRILVTGAGGSIGSELCRQIVRAGPGRLVLVDNSELNLYAIEMELREDHPGVALDCHLVDVSDGPAVAALFEKTRPQIVFHAAAYKHVPLLEGQIRSAVRNNVLGTREAAAAAGRFGSERFVLISTDKAVKPTSVMGATKRVAELICGGLDGGGGTGYSVVRFGNVLGSAGSVVPLFRRQIARGGPVTVTHPEIERFFMTIPEACQLIMQAAAIGKGGEVFVLDMGEPIKISYLAEQMIRLSGKRPGSDISIRYTGLRPGEKLYEELFYESEDLAETSHPKIRVARGGLPVARETVASVVRGLGAAVTGCDDEALAASLQRLVPDWRRDQPASDDPTRVPPSEVASG